MGQRAGAFGPYPHGRRFRILLRGGDGAQSYHSFASEVEAEEFRDASNRQLTETGRTVRAALAAFDEYQIGRGVKDGGRAVTCHRLKQFFAGYEHRELRRLTAAHGADLHRHLLRLRNRRDKTRPLAQTTQLNILAEARVFFAWAVKRGWLKASPLAAVEDRRRRSKGKPQLRIDEARAWNTVAMAEARTGSPGAIAALCTLLLGARASELTQRVVRDLDDEGRVLWIERAKTPKGNRKLEVSSELRPLLLKLAEGREPGELLFGVHTRNWPRQNVQRLCRVAKVPKVSAHAMRGLHSTLAMEAGATSHLVADALGHESPRTTVESYAAPGTREKASGRKVLKVLSGGKR
jgi:integrase